MGKSAHIVAIPFPAQGHVIPLMELSHRLADHGMKVTFVNTEFNHARVVAALEKNGYGGGGRCGVRLVSIPDGLAPEDDRNDIAKLCQAMYDAVPFHLEKLIKEVNDGGEDDAVTCLIADGSMGSAFLAAEKMGIEKVTFWPAPTGLLASIIFIPRLIDENIIDANGLPTTKQLFRLSPCMPEMNPTHFAWNCIGHLESRKVIFQFVVKNISYLNLAKLHLCNSFYEIEPSAFDLIPLAIPIGPLRMGRALDRPAGHFWPEDSTCLSWLDKHPPGSVIYVAFGSFTIFNPRQFHELALGLELTGRPFLWVVRPDLMDGSSATYPDGFEVRVGDQKGKMVSWAPQQEVLAHPSIACFLSHCGWNSTLEGLSNGVPFLCWPYFADQFLNQSYICDIWRTGYSLEQDGGGIISRDEMEKKVDSLIGDVELKARAMELAEKANKSVKKDGVSWQNLNNFIESLAYIE